MHNAVFVGWAPIRGRERQAAKVFREWVAILGAWRSTGKIESFTPVFLTPHDGGLSGFFLVTGEPEKLDELLESAETMRAIRRAQEVVDDFGVVRALTGAELGKRMATFQGESAESLSRSGQ
jgi:hypothetical protein